ncbi:TolC family protein [candidate division KSB1 bacterium]|nr:TolC family protein [candidate division KSB1 bacterium]
MLFGTTQLVNGQTQPANPDSALQTILKQLEGSPLPLNEATRHALAYATSVQKANAEYLAARGTVRKEKGFFDPELFFNLNFEDQEQPTASFFSGAPILFTKQMSTQTGLRWDLPIGTELEASLNLIRLKSNSSFAFLNPQYTTFGSVRFRQPLLGGFHISARNQLSLAEQELQAAESRRDQEVLSINAEVERSYWNLYAAERDYAVRKLTLDQGEIFLRETKLQADAGLIGPNQVASARTFLAEQKLLLLEREEQLDQLSDQLASLIGVRPENGMTRFITVDDPPSEFPLVQVDILVQHALQNNSDLKATQKDVEVSRTRAKAAGWEALPKVDLVGSLGGNGLAGTAQDVIFGNDTLRLTRSGGLGEAISQVRKRDFKTWSIGVEVSIPIGFRSGLGEKDRLHAEVILAEQRHIEQARALEEQVRTSHRELFHGRRRLDAAIEGVEAAQEQVRIGLIEFRNGRTTAFELVRLGADFALAQQRYSEALVRTAKAAATLKELTSGKYPGAIRE